MYSLIHNHLKLRILSFLYLTTIMHHHQHWLLRGPLLFVFCFFVSHFH